MANLYEPSFEQVNEWKSWLLTLPENVLAVASKLPPWKLYRIIETGDKVTLVNFDEHDDGRVTCCVLIGEAFNTSVFENKVPGLDPKEIEECDLPPSKNVLCGIGTKQLLDRLTCLIGAGKAAISVVQANYPKMRELAQASMESSHA